MPQYIPSRGLQSISGGQELWWSSVPDLTCSCVTAFKQWTSDVILFHSPISYQGLGNRERYTHVHIPCLMFCFAKFYVLLAAPGNYGNKSWQCNALPCFNTKEITQYIFVFLLYEHRSVLYKDKVLFWKFLLLMNSFFIHWLLWCTLSLFLQGRWPKGRWQRTVQGNSNRQVHVSIYSSHLLLPCLLCQHRPAPTPTLVTLCRLKSAELTVLTGTA